MVVSIIRTIAPYIAGVVGAWLLRILGVEIDTAAFEQMLIVVLGGLYYAIVRYLERNSNSKFGWLIGWASQPIYPGQGEGGVVATESTPDTLAGQHRRAV